jgi:Ca2+-binding RTX toxin-like protein
MGSGNDDLTITSTLSTSAVHGGLTTVHGGGNLAVQAAVAGVYTGTIAGDRITITGGGGPTSPLVVYGDTSQDAAWYAGQPYVADVNDTLLLGPNPAQPATFYRMPRANPFDRNGDDVIDASADLPSSGSYGDDALGIVIYGGAGNDTIRGSKLGDVLAGGSGDDTIFGNEGDDRIYGDSGVSVDVITRLLSVPTTDVARPTNDNIKSNRDGPRRRQGHDPGQRGRRHRLRRPRRGAAADPGCQQDPDRPQGQRHPHRPADHRRDDNIQGNAGRDRIFGGNGADTIDGGAESDVIFGDQGHMGYVSADYYRTADADIATLDVVESVDTGSADGKADSITDDSSDDIIFGGQGADVIDAGAGQNVVFGDHGRILSVDVGVNRPIRDPVSTKTDDDYQVQVLGLVTTIDAGTANGAGNEFGNGDDRITTGIGRDMIFGGGGADTINAFASSGGTAALDGNNIVFGDHGLVDYRGRGDPAGQRGQSAAHGRHRPRLVDRHRDGRQRHDHRRQRQRHRDRRAGQRHDPRRPRQEHRLRRCRQDHRSDHGRREGADLGARVRHRRDRQRELRRRRHRHDRQRRPGRHPDRRP